MLPLTIAEIVKIVGGVLVMGDPRMSVSKAGAEAESEISLGISTDSRALRKGDIFLALKGIHYDGHNFLAQSAQKGAALCVVSYIPRNFVTPIQNAPAIVKVKDTRKALRDFARFHREKFGARTEIVGVSGSCGKTTVKEMIAQILNRAGPTAFSPGNLNNEIGCPLSLFSLSASHRYGVFEIGGSALGEVRRLAEMVLPRVAVVTNIGLEHTETFGNLDSIAEGESEILQVLSAGGFAVIPRDDSFYTYLKSRVPEPAAAGVKSFGFSREASVYVDLPKIWPEPSRFTLVHQDEKGGVLNRLDCELPLSGRFNLANACAAAAACLCLNVRAECIVEGLKNFVAPKMRFQVTKRKDGTAIVNDAYNANPSSMRASLQAFVDSFPNQPKCVVLGDMLELGEISQKEHYALGQYVAGLPLNKVILFGSQSGFVAQGAKDSFLNEKMIEHCASPAEVLKSVRSLEQSPAAILFKASRGMRLDEVIENFLKEA